MSLGFKCGLEIHQQLEGKKLFCDCPTEIRKEKPDFSFDRRLRASAGETGEVDAAASYAYEKNKLFTYNGYYDINCLVEMDEEPPGPVNADALQTAVQVSKMLNCKIVDEVQFMRKTVVDGSNTSAFQRTGLIGRDGFIEVNGKKIGIESVCLEEEAAQVMNRTDTHDTYNLSRLGIPLLEIATAPDIASPEECKEVASKIGMILRSTGACKRGIGSIRQDVNISIKGGARTEVKGFQDLRSIPKVIEHEIKRQQSLIKKGKRIAKEVRKAEQDFTTSFLRPMPGAARMYPETDVATVKPKLDFKKIETIEEKEKRFAKDYDLNPDYAKIAVSYSDKIEDLEPLLKKYDPKMVVDLHNSIPKDLKKRFDAEVDISKVREEVLKAVKDGKLSKNNVSELLADYSKTKKLDFGKFKGASDADLEKAVKEIAEKNKGAPMGMLMGMVMKKFGGKVDGKKASELLRKYL